MPNCSRPTRLGAFALTILFSTTAIASADDVAVATIDIETGATEFEVVALGGDLESATDMVLNDAPDPETGLQSIEGEINALSIAEEAPLAPQAPEPVLITPVQAAKSNASRAGENENPFLVKFVLATGDANLCTNSAQYIGWLCAWQGYPRP